MDEPNTEGKSTCDEYKIEKQVEDLSIQQSGRG